MGYVLPRLRVCCWCGVECRRWRRARGEAVAIATREHLIPRSLGLQRHRRRVWLPWKTFDRIRNVRRAAHEHVMEWACSTCNNARGNRLGPPPGVTGGLHTRLWNEGMAYWLLACIPPIGYAPQAWVAQPGSARGS